MNYEHVYLENEFLMPLEWILTQFTDLLLQKKRPRTKTESSLCTYFESLWKVLCKVQDYVEQRMDYEMDNPLTSHRDELTNTPVQTP